MTSVAQASNPVLTRIRERGFWRVVLHPADFVQDRIGLSELYPLLQASAVRGRSWEFPLVGNSDLVAIGLDWIGQSLWGSPPLEYWRFYQSGQFVFYSGMREDWRDEYFRPRSESWQPGQELDIAYTVLRYTESFELAARLAASPAFREVGQMHIEVDLRGLAGRQLVMDDPLRDLIQVYRTSLNDFPNVVDIATIELLATARKQALVAAGELFSRFRWQPATQILQSIQEDLWKR